jgi:hypothetical protein
MQRTPGAMHWRRPSWVRLATLFGGLLAVSSLAAGCGDQEPIPEAQSHEQNVANHDIPDDADIHFVLYGWEPGVTVDVGDDKTFDDGLPTKTVDCGDQVQGQPCNTTLSSVPTRDPLTITFPELPAEYGASSGTYFSWQWPVQTSGASCDQEQSVLEAALKVNHTPPHSANLVCHIKIAGYVTIEAYWRSGTVDLCYDGPGNAEVTPQTLYIYSVVDFPSRVPSPPKMSSTGCAPPSDPLADRIGNETPGEGGTGPTGNSPGDLGEGGDTGNTAGDQGVPGEGGTGPTGSSG